ncbi:methyl-accepting chemotaxis protein [Propionivibrio dicarboxylicus]|uniref:Twitching motility protein PilJ n=1 Tax=Propionivibrio dicarboxylicus TaxID=83767 RepID=A0A1G8BKW2_9RHOO|nr:methyl-accepting chemotaxis protein [Propionivibrio dicarboxylicus]SDH33859.1 twitching motility protein PilJ [Propionivibrio dicarboxylicus]
MAFFGRIAAVLSRMKAGASSEKGEAREAWRDAERSGKTLAIDAADQRLLKPLPWIGHMPPRSQMTLLLAVMIAATVALVVLASLAFRLSARYSEMRAVSTEMQMLSQRLTRGMNLALLGDVEGFDVMEDAYVRFGNNLWSIEAKTGFLMEVPASLETVSQIWIRTFVPAAGKPSIHSLLDQKGNLVLLAERVNQANSADGMLSLLARDFAQVAAARLPARELSTAYQVPLAVSQMSRYTNSLLSGESYNPEWVPQLLNSIKRFRQLVNAFIAGDAALGIAPVGDTDLVRLLRRMSEQSEAYSQLQQIVERNNEGLVDARVASLAIQRDAEVLLMEAINLADFYERNTQMRLSAIGEVLLAMLALTALYLLVRVFNQETVRRRLASEAENKANQEAILRLLNDMADLADGDLTVRAMVTEDLTGAIADSINYTIEELRSLIIEINRATEQVTRTTSEAQRISQELLDAAGKQSSEIENTNRTVSLIVDSIQGVSASAAESSKVANASLAAAEQGASAVDNQIRGMGEIRVQIQETAKRIKRLGESSQEIGEIVELISDITEQTNVLALNAAIQAAAAGEAGRGFSVVAEEVQRLAERSGEATKQIAALVKTIQADTRDAVAAMELSTQGVVEGAKLSDAAGSALSEIGKVSGELARLIESIARETEDQNRLAECVNASMRDILAITELTSRGTKSSAETVGQLSTLAASLKGSVAGFKI